MPRCSWRSWWGLLRSAVIYRRPGRQRGLRRLYAPFVRRGDLVFDIGAHLGDRSIAMAGLGARVVAFEPQPLLRHFCAYGSRWRSAIDVRGEGLGREPGALRLAVSTTNPTVSSASVFWTDGLARANSGFASVRWDRNIDIRVTTLDETIAEFGVPVFCKIDVEGYEAEVLGGLSQPLPALSLEFVRGAENVALACLARLQELGDYRYNVIEGEGRRFHFDRWVDASALRRFLLSLPEGWSSGDVYARLATPTPRPHSRPISHAGSYSVAETAPPARAEATTD